MFVDTIDSLSALVGDRKIAAELLGKYTLQGLRDVTAAELQEVKGISTGRAARILATADLARRWNQAPTPDRPLVSEPGAVFDLLGPQFGSQEREHFVILLLNTKNKLLAQELVSIGHLNASLVHPRELFRVAIKHAAAGIIAAHNHPSGDTTPSPEDLALTVRLIDVGRLVGISLLDHVIISQGGYRSIAESHGYLWGRGPDR